MNEQELKIKHLTLENEHLKKQLEHLMKERDSLQSEYLNYMEYSELTILDLSVELNKLKGTDNTMSAAEFQKLFEECKLSEVEYYSS